MGMQYKHIKTGNLYQLMCVANNKSDKPNFPQIAVYRDVRTGEIYARPYAEFIEKFEKV